jgi:hypothetical protein
MVLRYNLIPISMNTRWWPKGNKRDEIWLGYAEDILSIFFQLEIITLLSRALIKNIYKTNFFKSWNLLRLVPCWYKLLCLLKLFYFGRGFSALSIPKHKTPELHRAWKRRSKEVLLFWTRVKIGLLTICTNYTDFLHTSGLLAVVNCDHSPWSHSLL